MGKKKGKGKEEEMNVHDFSTVKKKLNFSSSLKRLVSHFTVTSEPLKFIAYCLLNLI